MAAAALYGCKGRVQQCRQQQGGPEWQGAKAGCCADNLRGGVLRCVCVCTCVCACVCLCMCVPSVCVHMCVCCCLKPLFQEGQTPSFAVTLRNPSDTHVCCVSGCCCCAAQHRRPRAGSTALVCGGGGQATAQPQRCGQGAAGFAGAAGRAPGLRDGSSSSSSRSGTGPAAAGICPNSACADLQGVDSCSSPMNS